VSVDPRYFRPSEVDLLLGDPHKAKQKLGWAPKYNLHELIKEMVNSDLKEAKMEDYLQKGGYRSHKPFD
jgi:GDPmannose 4,6-dehydratase